ncbi:hypothetical protein [Micromonospora sp. RP3T]|uniref:hypothetical protein n=1 Tax=Micromonospora sp. RP3T TaxID=2135446 RepID=UPI003D75D584
MSSTALMWAACVAPVADVQEYAILVRMADEADEAGCGVWLATSTIAFDVKVSEKTVQRRLDALEARKLIGRGDQRLAAHVRPDRRPVVYDLLIPAECFPDVARTNARRVARGLPPLTPENRPVQDPPNADDLRARRSDIGKPRPRKLVDNPDGGRDDQAAEQPEADGGTTSHPATGGLSVTPSATGGLLVPDGVTSSPARGDYESPDPGVDPGIDPGSPPPVRTSVTTAPVRDDAATGGNLLDEQTRATLNAAALAAAKARGGVPSWKADQVAAAMREALDAGHSAAAVAARIVELAADTATAFPNRLRTALDVAAAEAARKAAAAVAPTSPAPAWAQGPFRYLDPARQTCPKHRGNPADNCAPCRIDDATAADRDHYLTAPAPTSTDGEAEEPADPIAAARAVAAAARAASRARRDGKRPVPAQPEAPVVEQTAPPAAPAPAVPETVGAAA